MLHVDILSISETKFFSNPQYLMTNFHQSFGLDISTNSGRLLVFVRSSMQECYLDIDTYLISSGVPKPLVF